VTQRSSIIAKLTLSAFTNQPTNGGRARGGILLASTNPRSGPERGHHGPHLGRFLTRLPALGNEHFRVGKDFSIVVCRFGLGEYERLRCISLLPTATALYCVQRAGRHTSPGTNHPLIFVPSFGTTLRFGPGTKGSHLRLSLIQHVRYGHSVSSFCNSMDAKGTYSPGGNARSSSATRIL